MATHRIIVLSDGTWESVGEAKVMEITDDAYANLCDGYYKVNDFDEGDVISTKEVE